MLFKRKDKESRDCKNCIYFNKEKRNIKASCSRTHNHNLTTFPFTNTKCKSFINKYNKR
jgi:hypothetical protein